MKDNVMLSCGSVGGHCNKGGYLSRPILSIAFLLGNINSFQSVDFSAVAGEMLYSTTPSR